MRGFERALKRATENNTSIHRGAVEGAPKRYRKKLCAKTTWYKQHDEDQETLDEGRGSGNNHLFSPPQNKNRQTPTTSTTTTTQPTQPEANPRKQKPTPFVLFVEQTSKGEYARRLRAAEPALSELTGFKVKIVERGGPPLLNFWSNLTPGRGVGVAEKNVYRV